MALLTELPLRAQAPKSTFADPSMCGYNAAGHDQETFPSQPLEHRVIGCAIYDRLSLAATCHEAVQEKTPRAKVKALESQHVIEVNANGLLYDLRSGQGRRLITDAIGVTNYLQQTIWAGFKNSGRTNLLVFIHGGLNDRDQGLQHYLDHYQEILNKNDYPV